MSLPTRLYLFTYNFVSFALWATCTLNAVHLVAVQHAPLPVLFDEIYHPLLTATQTFAVLEILHSLVGLVRAPLVTTAMQVASRLLLVWGVMYPFGMLGLGGDVIVGTGGGNTGALDAKLGDYAFAGCLGAWGVTECIRYGFFALQVSGLGVPGFWSWLRYNTFYILYPLGISSECALVVKALTPAAELNPLFHWFFIVVLGIYVPETQGSLEEGLDGFMTIMNVSCGILEAFPFYFNPTQCCFLLLEQACVRVWSDLGAAPDDPGVIPIRKKK